MGVLKAAIVKVEHQFFQKDIVILESIVMPNSISTLYDVIHILAVEEWDTTWCQQGITLQIHSHDNPSRL